MPVRSLTLAEAADELGVAPARIRSLIAAGALTALPGDTVQVAAADVAELAKRGTVRQIDVAALEGAVDRALRRRLPGLLETGLHPLQGEVATALADVEASARELTEAQASARALEGELTAARTRIGQLERQVAVLSAKPAGLLRRRPKVVALDVAPA